MKIFLCTYCKTESNDISGDNLCAICIRNDRDKCAHRPANGVSELYSKGIRLIKFLLDGYSRRSNNIGAKYQAMLPSEPVDCFAGYNKNLEKITEEQVLSDLVSEDGCNFFRGHIEDYSRHLLHTE